MKEADNDHHKHTTISHTQTHTKCQVIINAIKKKKRSAIREFPSGAAG